MIDMSSEDFNIFTLRINFPKTPKKKTKRKLYKEKLESWIKQEKNTMPFEKVKFSKTRIQLISDEFLFFADFGKPIQIILATRQPEKNLEKLNEIGNKIFSYLNTIMPQVVVEVEFESEYTIEEKKKRNLAKKVIGDSRIARISEIMKFPWNPIGLLFTWKTNSRQNLVMCASADKRNMIFWSSSSSWKNNIPLDAILKEKEEFLKFKDVISKLMEENLND